MLSSQKPPLLHPPRKTLNKESVVDKAEKLSADVLKYWKDKGLDEQQMRDVRHRCKTDGAFLAQCLGYNKFDPAVHTEVWQLFVQKDGSVPFEEFAKRDETTHDRMLLLPRGGFKSTADMVDSVQYIINWPDITILFITGKQDLGRDFLAETKGHFERQDDGQPRLIDDKSSAFQLAFPEHCIDGAGPADSFTTPARKATNLKEATLQFGGVETAMSGWHFDVIKFDDAVTNENSRNQERLKNVRNMMSMHRKMLNPYGYVDYIGTWYDINDFYGVQIKAEDKNKTLFWNAGQADSRPYNGNEPLTHIIVRPAMRPVQGEIILDGVLDAKDWILWFPERLTFRVLIKELSSNPETFATQYMNNPTVLKRVRIPRQRLVDATKPFAQLPELHQGGGIMVQSWDTAFKAEKSYNNYSVGTTALIFNGHFYFMDVVRGQYNDYELPQIMAETIYRMRPRRFVIEEINGTRWLMREVQRELVRMGVNNVSIEFMQPSNEKNRKEINAKPFAKALLEKRVTFSSAISGIDALYDEFEAFPNGDFDDIVDSVSTLVKYFGEIPEAMQTIDSEELNFRRQQYQDRLFRERTFGLGQFAVMEYTPPAPVESLPLNVTYSPLDEFN